MSKQIERILICLLWLLAASLGACFWLNTFFGFNIFSAQHWQYLAYLQAAQTPVRTGFYMSIVMLATATVIGLYILMRPRAALLRLRRVRLITPQQETKTETNAPPQTSDAHVTTPPVISQPAPQQSMRPKAPINSTRAAPQPTITNPGTIPTPATQMAASTTRQDDFKEIEDIFQDAGYVVKRRPQIGNFKPALFAIGTDENLWIGAVGIDQAPIAKAAERLSGVFSDTLDEIEIQIHPFIISPSAPISDPNILSFDNINQLREYIGENKNSPIEEAEGGKENFEAYSEYIDTVITYMDKT